MILHNFFRLSTRRFFFWYWFCLFFLHRELSDFADPFPARYWKSGPNIIATDAIGATKLIKCNRGIRKKRPELRMRFFADDVFQVFPSDEFLLQRSIGNSYRQHLTMRIHWYRICLIFRHRGCSDYAVPFPDDIEKAAPKIIGFL